MMPKEGFDREDYTKRCHAAGDELLTRLGVAQPRCGFSCGLGWLPIVERALKECLEVGWDGKLAQVKQKFCQLRIYVDFFPKDEVYQKMGEILSKAEADCDVICEICGKERTKKGVSVGWALCDDCGEA